MTRQAGSHRTRAIPRARESPCGTSRNPCSRARTRRSSAPDRSSISRAWLPWWFPPAVRYGASKAGPSKRVWTDDFTAVALAEFVAFIVIDRAGAIQEFLDVAAGGGRGVEKQDSAGFAAGVLPSMPNVAREECAGAGAADGNLVADLKGDLAGEHPGDLVAVTVEMEETLGTGGDGLLEQHESLIGLAAEELQGGEAAGCRHIEILPAAGGHDKAFQIILLAHRAPSHLRPVHPLFVGARPDR